ncbi:putative sulfate exporter family transporter [Kocuria coralli]|uniref:Putative sulfate exporter family transporter n=1 Tax=Kocuria coralli TaxID=1461025 RepID=A0A5J5KVE8_9MICC|nr:putative sulfate exporter family transporter [Kocuria coralli]KAA9393512.1 putative sulfate exporter family transporter [Kocuria coralli]
MLHVRPASPSLRKRLSGEAAPLVPGLGLCLAAAGLSCVLGLVFAGTSPLIIAVALGIATANIFRLPAATTSGIDFSARRLLRLGIVFLGLQLVLSDIAGLGAAMLFVIGGIVAAGLLGTVLMGRALRVPAHLTLLIACGFSICGAAAVAGVAGATRTDDGTDEDAVTAVALVVIFGTLMIPLMPFAASLLGLSDESAGMWAGGSIQEIAQVIAVGGAIGGGALTAAVVVKLARVLLLAPVVTIISIQRRRSLLELERSGQRSPDAKLPPIVPLFVLGFMAMVVLRSFVPLPEVILEFGSIAQTALLAAAMFALGCGVRIKNLLRVGFRPFALAALSTFLVTSIAYIGVVWVA